jgi:hypothetical protein
MIDQQAPLSASRHTLPEAVQKLSTKAQRMKGGTEIHNR